MIKYMFREITEDEDVTDIIAKIFAFLAIPAAAFVIIFSLWSFFVSPGNVCGPGIC